MGITCNSCNSCTNDNDFIPFKVLNPKGNEQLENAKASMLSNLNIEEEKVESKKEKSRNKQKKGNLNIVQETSLNSLDYYERTYKNNNDTTDLSSSNDLYKKLVYLDNSVYIGFTNELNLRDGKGKLTLPCGTTYEGGFKNDRYHGYGVLLYENGTQYKGEFKDGMRCGKGVLYQGKGNIYEGEWKDNLKNGLGKETFVDESVYEGMFVNNIKSLYGKLTKSNGEVYEGEFNNDKIEGIGIYKWPFGLKYEGNMIDGMIKGHGILTNYKERLVYKGEFYNNFRQGCGVEIRFSEKEIILSIGKWTNNEKDGMSIEIKGLRVVDLNYNTNYNSIDSTLVNKIKQLEKESDKRLVINRRIEDCIENQLSFSHIVMKSIVDIIKEYVDNIKIKAFYKNSIYEKIYIFKNGQKIDLLCNKEYNDDYRLEYNSLITYFTGLWDMYGENLLKFR